MGARSSNAERIVIAGGGFAGLAAAVRLAQAGLPVTVLEASKLGYAASTANQGWLYSGAWFAPTRPQLARQCYESLQQTIVFCPDCIEPDVGRMIYFSQEEASTRQKWTDAWEEVGIPYQSLLEGELNWNLPRISRDKVTWTMRLPDRSFRPQVLLRQLADTARSAGAEIRPNTFVAGLLTENRRAYGVAVGSNEEVRARLVILAIGAYSQTGFSQLFQPRAGRQSDYQLVRLKTHLRAVHPRLAADPFCCVDGIGLNHLPHGESSVFGTSRWQIVSAADATEPDPEEIALIDEKLRELVPGGFGDNMDVKDWAGVTVQAMHVDQVQPGEAPLPTVVDHSQQPDGVENVLSIFPGRATLWADLAEQVRTIVLEKCAASVTETSTPPWATMT